MYLFGASGHGKVVKEILTARGEPVEAFVDDNPDVNEWSGRKVLHDAAGLSPMIVSIGLNQIRKKIVEGLTCEFGTAIHPSAIVSSSARIGEGTVVMAGAVINADVVIGKHCIVNTGASIDHDCSLGDYVHIAPKCAVSGGVTIGEGTWVGVGSCVKQCLKIGSWNMIGAGSVVVKDLPDGIVAYGNPCKVQHMNGQKSVKKGMPMSGERNRIYLCLAHMSGKEQQFIKEAFDTNWVVPLGPNVNAFEEDLKQFTGGGKEVVALASGTAAVHLALLACGVGPGDEVLVQSFTFCASSHPVTYLGATPVFVDSEPASWNMDPGLLEKTIEERIARTGRKPKAIVPVALYGMPYRIDEIMSVADKYGIPVIEDAAEGFGSKFDGRVLGTFGKYGVLSFNGNKMITTSGGGALICPDAEAKKQIMFYATQAREAYPYYQHEQIGYNYRMSNICAGIGRGQMTVADEHIAHHKHVCRLYKDLLSGIQGVELHENPSPRYDSNYWLCTILLDPSLHVKGEEHAYDTAVEGAVGGAAGVTHAAGELHTASEPNPNVEAMRMALDAAGIESRPLWKPMHLQPVYARNPAYVNGASESLFKRGLCLPSGPYVSDEDVQYIVDQIPEINQLCTASSAEEACRCISSQPFDLYILDVELPDASGFELIDRIREKHPEARIIINTMHDEMWNISRLLQMKVSSVILKSSNIQEVKQAILTVLSGKQYFCDHFESLCRKLKNTDTGIFPNDVLTTREMDVLQAIADGLNTNEIAELLHLSDNTIESHRKRLMLKLNARNAVDLVMKAISKGIISLKKR